MNKFFMHKRLILIAGLLSAFGLLTNCAESPASKIIVANQSNGNALTPMPTPPPGKKSEEEFPPVEPSKISSVTYCDLIKNAADYDKKVVRVRAIYFSGFEKIYLYDTRCEDGQPPAAPADVPAETWAQRDRSFVSIGDSEEAQLNHRLDGFGRKDVTVIGRFYATGENGDVNAPNRFGHMNCCRFQFSVMRVENVVNLDGKPR